MDSGLAQERILIRDAIVMTHDAADRVLRPSDVLIDGGTIAAVGADAIRAEAREMVPAIRARNADLFDLVERVGKAVI